MIWINPSFMYILYVLLKKKFHLTNQKTKTIGLIGFIVRFSMNYIILFARILKISNSEFKQSFERKKPHNLKNLLS